MSEALIIKLNQAITPVQQAEYFATAVENPPNPHWASLKEAIKSDKLANVQRLIEEKQIALSEQNMHEKDNFTPLHLAAHNYAWQSALWLVKQGADLAIKDAYGLTPLYRLITTLNRHFAPKAQAEPILAIFDVASERAHPLPVERLAEVAIELNNADLLAYALQHGCSPNTISRFSGYPLLYRTVEESWFAGYEQLLRAEADPFQFDEDWPTLSEYIEEQLDQCLEALIHSPFDQRQEQRVIGLADFFRAEGRFSDFLDPVYEYIYELFDLPLDDDDRFHGLLAIEEVLHGIDPDLAIPVTVNDPDTVAELLENERYDEILDLLDKRIGVEHSPDLLYFRTCVLYALKRNREAEACQALLVEVLEENLAEWLSYMGTSCFIIFDKSGYKPFNYITLQVIECLPLTFNADDPVWEEELLESRCDLLELSGRYDEILSVTEQYLAIREAAKIWRIRGKLLQWLQRPREALDSYLKALEIGFEPGLERDWTREDVIKLAAQLNDTALARKHYELLDEEDLTPAFERAKPDSKASWLCDKMDYLAYFDLPAAEKGYRQLLEDELYSNNSGRTRYRFGQMLRRAGKREAEIELWQEYLSQQPKNMTARKHIGWLFYYYWAYEQAILHLQQALTVGSTQLGFAWWVLGNSHYKLGQIDTSIHSLQQALTGYEEDSDSDKYMEIRLDLAFAYHANKQAEAAFAIAEKASHYWQQEAERYANDSNSAKQWLRATVALRQPEATFAALKNLLQMIPPKRQANLEWQQDDADMQFVREQEACREIMAHFRE